MESMAAMAVSTASMHFAPTQIGSSRSNSVLNWIGPATPSFSSLLRSSGKGTNLLRFVSRPGGRLGPNVITSQAKSEDVDSIGPVGIGAIAGGLVANPVVAWSLYTLKTTGCGLPPGPGGSIGAIEGVSYLVVVGVIGWSVYTKVKTGSGLPQGPFGLLGAVEGVSYLSLLAIVVVFGLQALDFGFIPGPLPGEQCFG